MPSRKTAASFTMPSRRSNGLSAARTIVPNRAFVSMRINFVVADAGFPAKEGTWLPGSVCSTS
jgi:hypothetical protein